MATRDVVKWQVRVNILRAQLIRETELDGELNERFPTEVGQYHIFFICDNALPRAQEIHFGEFRNIVVLLDKCNSGVWHFHLLVLVTMLTRHNQTPRW